LSQHLWVSTNSPKPYLPIDIIGNQVGVFQLLLTVTNECGSSTAIIYVTVENCRGDDKGGFGFRSASSESVESNIDIRIFPNPSNDYITVSCDNCDVDSNIKVSVLSPDGKVIHFTSLVSNISKIDLTQMLSGLYILKVDIEGEIYYQKIIKI
jgi:hypothetical protein